MLRLIVSSCINHSSEKVSRIPGIVLLSLTFLSFLVVVAVRPDQTGERPNVMLPRTFFILSNSQPSSFSLCPAQKEWSFVFFLADE
jgi:hypothetical protein